MQRLKESAASSSSYSSSAPRRRVHEPEIIQSHERPVVDEDADDEDDENWQQRALEEQTKQLQQPQHTNARQHTRQPAEPVVVQRKGRGSCFFLCLMC